VIETLAAAALCGVPVARIVAGDDVERALWLRVAERAIKLRGEISRADASHVGAAVARAFK
jgi:hypothetical protein